MNPMKIVVKSERFEPNATNHPQFITILILWVLCLPSAILVIVYGNQNFQTHTVYGGDILRYITKLHRYIHLSH